MHIDCISGLFCDTADILSPVCKPVGKADEFCNSDDGCGPGLFCFQNSCLLYFTVPVGRQPDDARQCITTIAQDVDNKLYKCQSVDYVMYGPYEEVVKKSPFWVDLDQNTLKCDKTFGIWDNKGCLYLA